MNQTLAAVCKVELQSLVKKKKGGGQTTEVEAQQTKAGMSEIIITAL